MNSFGSLPSKVNWQKNENFTTSDELSRKLVLPDGLYWKSSVVTEKIVGRLRRLKWIWPHVIQRRHSSDQQLGVLHVVASTDLCGLPVWFAGQDSDGIGGLFLEWAATGFAECFVPAKRQSWTGT